MDIMQFASLCAERWNDKTLADLMQDALAAESGVVTDAVRKVGGETKLLLICVTGDDNIQAIDKMIDFGKDGEPSDWKTLKLVEFMMRSMAAGGICYESCDGAIALCASTPEMSKVVSQLFTIGD